MEEEDYFAYEINTVEEVPIDCGASLCWKEGREYRQVGWLRFPGRECKFQVYRNRADTIVAVEHLGVCEECIARVRELTSARGCELVELRAKRIENARHSC